MEGLALSALEALCLLGADPDPTMWPSYDFEYCNQGPFATAEDLLDALQAGDLKASMLCSTIGCAVHAVLHQLLCCACCPPHERPCHILLCTTLLAVVRVSLPMLKSRQMDQACKSPVSGKPIKGTSTQACLLTHPHPMHACRSAQPPNLATQTTTTLGQLPTTTPPSQDQGPSQGLGNIPRLVPGSLSALTQVDAAVLCPRIATRLAHAAHQPWYALHPPSSLLTLQLGTEHTVRYASCSTALQEAGRLQAGCQASALDLSTCCSSG